MPEYLSILVPQPIETATRYTLDTQQYTNLFQTRDFIMKPLFPLA